jgi:hypothetical protein
MEIEEVEAGLNRLLVARFSIHSCIVASLQCVVLIRRFYLDTLLIKSHDSSENVRRFYLFLIGSITRSFHMTWVNPILTSRSQSKSDASGLLYLHKNLRKREHQTASDSW